MTAAATLPAGSVGRDIRVIGLVGVAHGFSHFYQMAMPPLFFLMKDTLGVSYTELGFLMTVFYIASGFGQTAAGFMVDRFGGCRILLTGLAMLAGSITLAGVAPNYWALMPLAVIGGLGNSVFHPADFAILNGNVAQARIGRAYGVHGVGGNIGWGVASAASLGLGLMFGWRAALIGLGAVGLLLTVLLATQARYLSSPASGGTRAAQTPTSLRDSILALFAPAILFCFAYFVLIAMALIGVQNWGANILGPIYQVAHERAALAVTLFLFGSAAGVLVGGWLADHTPHHAWIAATGMAVAALLTLVVAGGPAVPELMLALLTLIGFSLGATNPSRDMLVRNATPPGSSGKVFGFVYSGLDVGSCTAPLLFGWMLDHGLNKPVLIVMAGFMALTIVTIVAVRAQGAARGAAVPAE